ncbi:MAG: bifunctional 23S rRNA (guanine(2069)-N(7))-methyltransferase RlmK/23S rRNA (guanine(2445)-N(2))-methyltransferase RlmL [Gammaproteobacteria bacterium]|nr:MAG: bifunctional 23S rRNA (guanine(2069)-N(7))-methyltransferase RlmK/23S rRNA (guanine(2445)-N(2))-methyltransferase RlmL [Gammaproteobacteria bacterium]
MISPCPSAASSNPASDATSRCTPSRSTRSSRRPGSTCRDRTCRGRLIAPVIATKGPAQRDPFRCAVSPPLLALRASAPRGFADLLTRELEGCGAREVRERATGAAFLGTLESAYRACLWSRIANRVFVELAHFDARDADEFHAAVREIDWAAHLAPGTTLACDFSGRHPAITHTHFGALKLKDGIVDALRLATGARPDIALERPGVRVHAHAQGSAITVSLDLSGESLHRRGYRGAGGEAPLKENVAAGVLLRAGWPELAARGGELLDPLCGSGTFCIEAALIAADRAPGLRRDYFGFLGWRRHEAPLWVRFETGLLAEAAPLAPREADRPGLLCANPPYGVRLADREGARTLHRELGEVLRERFQGWDAAVLTGAPELGMELGLRAHRTHCVWNGPIECRLLRIKVSPESAREPGTLGRGTAHLKDTPGARMFANRLAKNLKRLRSWAEREGVSCYRVYDADMPEYAFAIDSYRTLEPEDSWLCVQEYAAPKEIEPEAVHRRRGEVLAVLPETTGVPEERLRLRTRRRTRRGEQYGKLDRQARFRIVSEGGLKFYVNFEDYLDTGLFLDHRMTRARLREASHGKRFLNLFAYTGTATVYAAAGGAASTATVDLSRTYLDWAQRNLVLNGFTGAAHQLVQADCRGWLPEAAQGAGRFDLIFLDPPTFSNSKRMEGVLDVARDHSELIDGCARLLSPGGLIVFSTNAQRFRLEDSLRERYEIQDVSAATLPKDFERNPRIHSCYEIRLSGGAGAKP